MVLEIGMMLHGGNNKKTFFVVPNNCYINFGAYYGTMRQAYQKQSIGQLINATENTAKPGVIVNNLHITAGDAGKVFVPSGIFMIKDKSQMIRDPKKTRHADFINNIRKAFKNDIFGWRKYYHVAPIPVNKMFTLESLIGDLRRKFPDETLLIHLFTCRGNARFLCANKLPFFSSLITTNELLCNSQLTWETKEYNLKSYILYKDDALKREQKKLIDMQYAIIKPNSALGERILLNVHQSVIPFYLAVVYKGSYYPYPSYKKHKKMWKKLILSSQLELSSIKKRKGLSKKRKPELLIMFYTEKMNIPGYFGFSNTTCQQTKRIFKQKYGNYHNWITPEDASKVKKIEKNMMNTDFITFLPKLAPFIELRLENPGWSPFMLDLFDIWERFKKTGNNQADPYLLRTPFVCMFYILYDIFSSKRPRKTLDDLVESQKTVIKTFKKKYMLAGLLNRKKLDEAKEVVEMLNELRKVIRRDQ